MISTARYIKEIKLLDPDTLLPVELTIYKHENGGIFGVDSSYIEQCLTEDEAIQDPLNEKGNVLLLE